MFSKMKARNLEAARADALARVRDQRMVLENMILRCRGAGEVPDAALTEEFSQAMVECERRLQEATLVDEIDDLAYQAETRAALRAYLCPIAEICTEAKLAIEQMQDWGVSPSSLKPLQDLIAEKLQNVPANPAESRGVLRAILRELNIWEDYTDDYEAHLRTVACILAGCAAVLFLGSVLAFYFRPLYWPLFPLSFFLAGGAGSCASVLARLPAAEVTSSSLSESLVRRIITRVGTGVIASVAGSAIFAWGLAQISINGVSFGDIVNACDPLTTSKLTCSSVYGLVVLAVPIMFGFSERLLTTLDQKLLGRIDEPEGP